MNELTSSENDEQLPVVSTQAMEVGDEVNQHAKHLTFRISDETYGVSISAVKEIIEYPSVTSVPMTPSVIRGVINLRGNVVPVIDLAVRLGMDASKSGKRSCVIIVELEADDEISDVGFMVDAVSEVVDISADDIEAAPSFGAKIRSDFISGMGKRNDEFVVLLALPHVLSIRELSELINTTENE